MKNDLNAHMVKCSGQILINTIFIILYTISTFTFLHHDLYLAKG
jgi:hypothetical protein